MDDFYAERPTARTQAAEPPPLFAPKLLRKAPPEAKEEIAEFVRSISRKYPYLDKLRDLKKPTKKK